MHGRRLCDREQRDSNISVSISRSLDQSPPTVDMRLAERGEKKQWHRVDGNDGHVSPHSGFPAFST